ncbi:hypothetical protein MPSEU_001071800 [Mayamaea pseudoterrestris]|nr:hypothetical protein MPSEU_001071800 [Mayamaea pseudoterrestris]
MHRIFLWGALLAPAAAFAPTSPRLVTSFPQRTSTTTTNIKLNMVLDPINAMDAFSIALPQAQDLFTSIATSAVIESAIPSFGSDLLTAFADQGQNLAGMFFQASLLPYLLFLYFLSFKANRIPSTANFGFQFILVFVLSTIPSGILSKAVYGTSLANVDWLHGGAESLLTVANVLVVLGLKQALTDPEPAPEETVNNSRNLALATAGIFAVACGLGTNLLGFGVHSPFLFGIGDLPSDFALTLPWVNHNEPANALSIPTWAIHFSSIFEYLYAMSLVWDFSKATNNPKWKGLTWGMLPLHASGVCACTYHFFYNVPELQFLVSSQAGLTFLGNLTCMIAAFRIARSNGWTLANLNPLPQSSTSPEGLVAEGIAAMPLIVDAKSKAVESNQALAAKLVAATLATSYLVKYGELGLDLPFTPNPLVATAMIVGIPAMTAYQYFKLSDKEGQWNPLGFLSSENGDGAPALSMSDVKKYGVAGTLAYVLTELAFWIVAFPVAAYALYQSTGHWPDVINETTDRAAVLGFIFAGANIARLFVPVRLGAALALAPWVDENILGGSGGTSTDETSVR